jgi:hypothetical protein
MSFTNLPINEEIDRFKKHLDQQDNNRIIFSGIFGIGKTYFMQNFFENSDEYLLIKLNPVNYSIASNEDIFELIKFDIAFQLLSKDIQYQKETFSKILTGQFFALDNYKKIISLLFQNLGKLNHIAGVIIEPALKLGKELESYSSEYQIDEKKQLLDFLDFFKDQKGSIKEENNISLLLSTLIESYKINELDKKVVLVIDDLDRIDPEHIFRLLNVFSAHFDFQNIVGENKFGFDKVVLICDIENIRGIYHSKYGADIDFSGYIDKFYSSEIYYYSIENVLKTHLQYFIKSINSSSKVFKENIDSIDSYIYKELEFLFSYFIDCGEVSLRNLLSFLQQEVSFKSYNLISPKLDRSRIHSSSTPILMIIEILEKFFGTKQRLSKAIDKAISKYPLLQLEKYGNYVDAMIGNLAMLAGYSNTHLLVSNPNDQAYRFSYMDYVIDYQISWYNHSYGIIGHMITVYQGDKGDPNLNTPIIIPYFQLLKLAIQSKNEIVKKFD